VLLSLVLMACLDAVAPLPEAEPPEPPGPELPPPPPPRPPPNRAPSIDALSLQPRAIDTNTDIRADVKASDPEGIPLRTTYSWHVNDSEILQAREVSLDKRYFEKGDKVRLVVTVDDGEKQKQKEASITVANASPSFLTDPRSLTQLDGFQLKVTDPDDDEVSFRMQGAPRGMSIGKKSGTIRYEGSLDEPGGDYDITIFAEDEDGGEARWEFSVAVQPGSGAPE